MTVSTTDIVSGPYAGDAVNAAFNYNFTIQDKTQVLVYETDDVGVVTTLTVDTNYTVAGVGVVGGGVITRVAGALPLNYSWSIIANYPENQLTDFSSQGGFFPDVHENAIDKLTFLLQQIKQVVSRVPRFSLHSTSVDLPIADPVADSSLIYNSTGDGIINGPDLSTVNAAISAGAAAAISEAAAAISEDAAAASEAAAAISETNAASITGSGNGVFTIDVSTTQKFIGNVKPKWLYASQLGSDLNITGAATTQALTALNGTDVAYIDGTNDDLRTYRFNGTTWSQIGSDLNIAGVGTPELAALNGTDVAFWDDGNKELRTYRFNGTTWSQLGNSLSIPSGLRSGICRLTSSRIVRFENGSEDLTVHDWDGTDWSTIGTAFNIVGGNDAGLTSLNSTDIAFTDDNITARSLKTYRFNGTTWSQVGNGLTITATLSNPFLTTLNSTDIAFSDNAEAVLRIYRWDGTDWSQIGEDSVIAAMGSPSIAALNGTDIAFIDGSNSDLRTYRFAFTNDGDNLPFVLSI